MYDASMQVSCLFARMERFVGLLSGVLFVCSCTHSEQDLRNAARDGDRSKVQVILKSGDISVDVQDDAENTPFLMLASRRRSH